ncbi:conserved hypothetical protein [Candidatus Sulfobium mesophilum]|uniref:4Fe-4S ferredoxin-type domain-containing protein n=1 Tax=Candidatus Sulfobium mesophilum TaxID=2016548 RepID=A0A2U3QJM9_9BACT|nr:conserved hypothetical protein [Candidatus Sulfobium mesophilum]
MGKSTVIVRQASYDYRILKPVIFEILDSFCGDLIRPGSRVVLKPNLLAPAPPEKAMVTHPLVVKAVTEYAIEKGCRVQISDSPAMGSFARVLNESGLRLALKDLDVEFREFKEFVRIDIGEPFRKIEIAKDAIDADIVINLPKLKTHVQMRMTLGVKNLFGCIVGLRKPEWHFRTGVNRELFSFLLARIAKAVNPAVTILDGILSMEGEGPGRSGTPRELGIMAGSNNAYALDVSICEMLGIEPFSVFTNKAARDMGLIPDNIEIIGDVPAVTDFKVPDIVPLVFGPKILHGFMRRHLVQRPLPDVSSCRLCGQCWTYCPAKAIWRDRGQLRIDYHKCIRCYCCIEVCPHAALHIKEPLLGRAVRRLKGK